MVDALELILSNFKQKPAHGDFYADLIAHEFDTDTPLKVKNIAWKKREVSMKSKINSTDQNSLKGMKCVFVNGIAVGLMASKNGKIYSMDGKEKRVQINRFGYPFIETELPYGLGKSKRLLVDIIVESYLLPYKDRVENYHFSYLDKDKKNCDVDNIMMWKEGSAGIAIKKTVRVFKEGKFFGIFDSVSTCAKVIKIPRRRVSEMLKGEGAGMFTAQEIKLW